MANKEAIRVAADTTVWFAGTDIRNTCHANSLWLAGVVAALSLLFARFDAGIFLRGGHMSADLFLPVVAVLFFLPVWVAYAVTGSTKTASLVAIHIGFGIVEILSLALVMFLLFCFWDREEIEKTTKTELLQLMTMGSLFSSLFVFIVYCHVLVINHVHLVPVLAARLTLGRIPRFSRMCCAYCCF